MSYWHLQTATGEPVVVAAAGGIAASTDRRDASRQRQLAVDDDVKVTGYVLDLETRRQNAHMAEV